MTVRIPELRAIARRRSLSVLAAALVIADCAASVAQQSQTQPPPLTINSVEVT